MAVRNALSDVSTDAREIARRWRSASIEKQSRFADDAQRRAARSTHGSRHDTRGGLLGATNATAHVSADESLPGHARRAPSVRFGARTGNATGRTSRHMCDVTDFAAFEFQKNK
jgi:hypothetical protein